MITQLAKDHQSGICIVVGGLCPLFTDVKFFATCVPNVVGDGVFVTKIIIL